jgi:hypothetical protein
MRFTSWALCGAGVLGLAACSPALNWREVRFDDNPVRVMLPCKPDRAERTVTLGEAGATLRMMGCEAQGWSFTWSRLDLPSPGQASTATVMRAWQGASLQALGADPVLAGKALAQPVKGARADWSPIRLSASAGGHHAHWVWWLHAGQAYQLAIYAPRQPAPEAVLQTLLEGIQLP